MGGSSKPNFPSPPEFQADPFLTQTQQGLFDTGDALRQGRFQDPNDPTVGFLNQLVNLNPEISQQAFGLATRDVVGLRDRAQQDILNQLEANNQLTSSVTGNRLSDLNEAFSSDIADIASQIQIADVERSLANTASLFGTGLDVLNQVGQRGLQNQQQVNTFAENRFQSEVALESERFSRQLANEAETARTVGFFTGPVGGAIFGGIQSGGPGASAGLSGGLELANLAISGISAFSGGGGGGSQDQGLNQRLLLLDERNRRGVA